MSHRIAIIAHRGYSSAYRENSPAAWTGAIAVGADVIEVDLRITADHAIVCSHDRDLQRLAFRADLVADTSSADLSAIDAAGFPACPPLALLLSTVPAHQSLLFDIKDERPEALDLYIAALNAIGRTNLILGLHANDSVRYVRQHGWTGKVLGFLADPLDDEAFFPAGGDIIRIWESQATDHRIGSHVALGRPVWITVGEHETGRTVGDFAADTMVRMAKAGATGFLVNDPLGARLALSAL